jgi:membrane protease YdiL (CAAX protease family)
MDHITLENVPAEPRPFGPLGLILSLGMIALMASAALGASLGLVVLGESLLFGWPHLRDAIQTGLGALQNGRRADMEAFALAAGCAVYLAVILGVWAMARLRAGSAWRQLLGWTQFTPDLIYWGLLLASILYQLGASLVVAYVYPPAKDWVSIPDSSSGLAIAFLMIVVLAPLAEELLFRGWLYTALRWRFGFGAALWTTAILFAVAHWESTHLYALAILPMGLVLGYVRERTGSARASTLFHMLYNFFGLTISFVWKV